MYSLAAATIVPFEPHRRAAWPWSDVAPAGIVLVTMVRSLHASERLVAAQPAHACGPARTTTTRTI
jgi:hypothetical protein